MLTGLPAKTTKVLKCILETVGSGSQISSFPAGLPRASGILMCPVRLHVREGVCSISQTFPFFLGQPVTSHLN